MNEDGARLLTRWQNDLEVFSKQILKIQTKTGDTVPLTLNAAQQIVHRKLEAQRAAKGYVRAIVLKARQEGISTYTAARFFRGTLLWEGRNALVVAHRDESSEALYRIYDRYYGYTPDIVRPKLKGQARGKQLLFETDTQIAVGTAGGKEIGRALTRFFIHGSEVAFWPNQVENLTGILQTVPQQAGEVILESTANGVGDEWHARWLAAEAGESDYIAIFLPWFALPEYSLERYEPFEPTEDERIWMSEGIEWEGSLHPLTEAQVAWRRWKIANDFGGDARVFRQEYPSTAREAFLVSGSAFFEDDSLLNAERMTTPPTRMNIRLSESRAPVLSAAERGPLRVWEKPKPHGHYVIGADTAEGKLSAARDLSLSDPMSERGGRDFSSADVVKLGEWVQDPETESWHIEPCRVQVAQLHARMPPEQFAEGVFALGMLYACEIDPAKPGLRDPALVAIERNHSSGQTVIRWLRDHGYKRQFMNRRINLRNEMKPSSELGWITSQQTRMPLLDDLAAALRLPTDDQGYMLINCSDTVREMFTFVWSADEMAKPKPEAQEGCHDDRVFSLGVALQMERFHRHAVPLPKPRKLVVSRRPTGL